MISRILIACWIFTITTVGYAVSYTIPGDDTDWYTLEYIDEPYGVVANCQGLPGTLCDVPAGTYKLVNQNSGAIRQGIVIGGDTPVVFFAQNTCSGGYDGTIVADWSAAPKKCSVSCPTGVTIGVSACSASVGRAGIDPPLPSSFAVSETGVECILSDLIQSEYILVNSGAAEISIVVGAVCIDW